MLNEYTKKAPTVAPADVKKSKFKLFTNKHCTTLKKLEKQRDHYGKLLIKLVPSDQDWEPVKNIYRFYDKQVRNYVEEF